MIRKPLIERFMAKVDKNGTNGCWLWTGATRGYRPHNYPHFAMPGGKQVAGHRLSYEMHKGEIPMGQGVCHKCDNTTCVNPDHLFLGSQKVNMNDCARKGRLGYRAAGTAHSQSKLNPEKVKEILARVANGETKCWIAKDYEITPQNINAILKGMTWNHVSGIERAAL